MRTTNAVTAITAHLMLLVSFLLSAPDSAHAEPSLLWGDYGELWDPHGRLPDFSYAGYKAGREPIPDVPVVTNVRDFGAVGDGVTDDTDAFKAAVEATTDGALLVPAGRYLIRDVIRLSTDHVVMRGEGPENTVIYIDRSLSDVKGGWQPDFSWGYGFLEIVGTASPQRVAEVVAPSARGDRELSLDTTEGIDAGDLVTVRVVDAADGSLGLHLHNGQEPASRCGDTRVQFNWQAIVAEVDRDANTITLDDPMPIDLQLSWTPEIQVRGFIEGAGIEDLAVEFPSTTYPGHLNEMGYNAMRFVNARNSWIRNVEITNADSGIFVSGKHLTVENVTLFSERPRGPNGNQGHHGVGSSQSGLFRNIRFEATFSHHITVSNQAARNVFVEIGGSETIRLDHHRRSPIENLFTAFDADWNYRSGGSGCEGPHAGARNTYWGMPGPMMAPCNVGGSGQCWGHIQSNVVGSLGVAQSRTTDAEWYEQVDELSPRDLYAAQLERRLAIEDRSARFSPLRFGLRGDWEERNWRRWAVVEHDGDARYALMTTTHSQQPGERLGEYSLAPTPPLGDVTISARAKAPEPLDERYRDVVLILGYQDDDNYEYAMFNSDVDSTALFAVRDGQRQELARATRSIITDHAWHTITFRRVGTSLEMLWDEELVASADTAALERPTAPGRVGVGTYNDAAFFDDIVIESPDLPEPPDPETDAGLGDEGDAGHVASPDASTAGPGKGGSDAGGSGGDAPDAGGSDPVITSQGGCGCSATASGSLPALWFVLLILGLRRPRRSKARP